jgi:hypothetical protein
MISKNQQRMYAGLALLAVSALAVMSIVGPMQSANAQPANEETRQNAVQTARNNLLAVGVQAQADVDVENNNICVIAETCRTDDN